MAASGTSIGSHYTIYSIYASHQSHIWIFDVGCPGCADPSVSQHPALVRRFQHGDPASTTPEKTSSGEAKGNRPTPVLGRSSPSLRPGRPSRLHSQDHLPPPPRLSPCTCPGCYPGYCVLRELVGLGASPEDEILRLRAQNDRCRSRSHLSRPPRPRSREPRQEDVARTPHRFRLSF